MSDLVTTGSSVATGAGVGALVYAATRSVPGAAIGGALGLAAGGLASHVVQQQNDPINPLKPRIAVPLTIGAGLGIGLSAMFRSVGAPGSVYNSGAYMGAAAIVGGLGLLALANLPWPSIEDFHASRASAP